VSDKRALLPADDDAPWLGAALAQMRDEWHWLVLTDAELLDAGRRGVARARAKYAAEKAPKN
jgi:hypothetical protein